MEIILVIFGSVARFFISQPLGPGYLSLVFRVFSAMKSLNLSEFDWTVDYSIFKLLCLDGWMDELKSYCFYWALIRVLLAASIIQHPDAHAHQMLRQFESSTKCFSFIFLLHPLAKHDQQSIMKSLLRVDEITRNRIDKNDCRQWNSNNAKNEAYELKYRGCACKRMQHELYECIEERCGGRAVYTQTEKWFM